MIKVNRGNIEIAGSSAEIINDLADAIKGTKCALKNGGAPESLIETMISDAVRYSNMTRDERIKDALKTLQEFLDKNFNTLKTETENGGTTDDQKPE